MDKNNHYFYVLECADGSYYAGYTNDVNKRVNTHNDGKGAKYTRGRRPVVLRYVEEYQTKTEAMQAEYRFKQLSRGAKERIVQMGGTDNEGPKKL
ncbi:GIY-YIG nuclease family protein [Pradoshia sp. D12]|jgi:putative endonuclease|uniref:GIY-YIG nuclease family protein n=1 Tax=Bacillaceae TaxID=186817 RepID=UPI00080ADB30|nr:MULTISPECIES: GIY-YIG nuclease family protein [Bacillaceae]OCA88478.1 hypothetical protein A8L44_18150 [Bacillus sp. FJAT-27986]QFK69825.1 GIY-YIG nuclease family protein [Pradoshia sp. D12]